MCSRFARPGGQAFAFASTFSASALPELQSTQFAQQDGGGIAPPEKFVSYITDGFLHVANQQGKCGSCWAFVIAQALRAAADIAYRRLGRIFDAKYLSVQYLLSCYEVPEAMCGCVGGDLARAFEQVSRRGTVLERSFPYDNNARPELSILERDVVCAQSPQTLETCPPCGAGRPPKRVGARVVDCVPCGDAAAPFYYPSEPFRITAGGDLPARVAAVKRELLRTGPVCCVIGVNEDALRAVGEPPRLVRDVTEAPTYAPDFVSAQALKHAVLIVGYYDPPGRTARSVWVCRNSWGSQWGYRVRANHLEPREGGGGVDVSQTELGGFFNISMYERQVELGLLDSATSFREVLVKEPRDAAPRPLRYTDVNTQPLPKLNLAVAPPSGPSISVEASAPPWRLSWLLLALLLALLLLLLLLALPMLLHRPPSPTSSP